MSLTPATIEKLKDACLALMDECKSFSECTAREQAVVRLTEALVTRLLMLERAAGPDQDRDELGLMETLLSLAAHVESGALKSALGRGRGNNLAELLQVLGLARDAASLEETAIRKADRANALKAEAGTDLYLAEKQERDRVAREKGLK